MKQNMKVASYKTFNKNFFLNSVLNDFASAIFPNKLKLSVKSFLSFYHFIYFLPMKRVQDTCFKNSLVVLQFSFLRRHKSKMIFDQTTPVNSDRKCKMSKILSSAQRQLCSSRNSILLQVTRFIQLVHRQNMETSAEIFFIPA